ncbi:type III-B CRISPR module-associated protein Cmr3 [Archaeoglobales archaeon]|nr:MAG: type III-B CRISPR module-associated protein Cmr3 [Archaeoglobales archaeon]
MRRLFIEPIDVLMFRSERPFTAREVHVAKTGVISPLTFEGAIKSKIFSEFCKRKGYSSRDFQRSKKRNESPEDFKKAKEELVKFVKQQMEKDDELKNLLKVIDYSPLKFPSKLNVLGVFFAKKGEFMEYFPIPNDVVREDRESGKIVKLQPKENFQFKWMNKKVYVSMAGYSQVKNVEGFMSFNDLINYLNGGCPKLAKIKYKNKELNKPYFKEIRSGIELEKDRKRTVEGALYAAEFLRVIENWGFVVWYDSPDSISLPEGLIKLGGESRGAISQTIEDRRVDLTNLIKGINKDKKFKLYLATPSYFNGCISPKNKLEEVLGIELELVAAFPGKPIYIGGYDFALNKEKPLRRWVNAGAVYYYKFKGEVREDLSLPIKILDKNLDMRCAFIGRW